MQNGYRVVLALLGLAFCWASQTKDVNLCMASSSAFVLFWFAQGSASDPCEVLAMHLFIWSSMRHLYDDFNHLFQDFNVRDGLLFAYQGSVSVVATILLAFVLRTFVRVLDTTTDR